MADKMINVGTAERPVLVSVPEHVPEHALRPETEKGRNWWGKLADGSVVLGSEELDRLLELSNGKKD